MKIRTFFAHLGAALTLSFSSLAQADISLTYQSQANPEHRSTILVSEDFIRFENPMAPEFFMLFDAKRQHMTLVDSDKRSYSILDRETLESLSEQIEVTRRAIMAELKAGMKVANAEEKEQMAMILEQIQQLAQAPKKQLVEYQPMNKEQEINGYTCQMIEALVNGETQARLCVTKSSDVGIPDSAMSTLESFHNFSSGVHQQLNPGDTTELLFVMNSKNQLPVSIERTYPISAADEYRLTDVQTLTIPASAFKVPEAFEAKDIEDAFIVE
ncbi:hypothetical protein [Oceanospirillum linum]|uniref:DUF4412 domain-containing protein n=1 Tax=Oceanospirillum linum TaxID=966 RepID=A0A1T1HFS7_OCELI|nr:hypothetical protein [Oceanospirillum linum]OOV88662.1 hypothetical protein BTA35_0204055 [Oceanospirillum linum]SEG03510.1 hypothetical protein SAMN04489856_104177 [Oleiphilus messinensis]SMP21188.1 hypothetical protein SAMN06264348_10482 [Oceanospirillum linum]